MVVNQRSGTRSSYCLAVLVTGLAGAVLLVVSATGVWAWGPNVPGENPHALEQIETFGTIERLDPKLDQLVAADAKLHKLATGFDWSEGPCWSKQGKFVTFSDVPANKAYRWKEGQGLSVFLEPSGYTGKKPRGGEPGSNGQTRDSQGRLVLCQHGDRRVVQVRKDGGFTTLASTWKGKRFNSPNDLVFKSNGDLYFTDPPYGLVQRENDPAREIGHFGVYRLSTDGKVTLLTDVMTRPNGIAFSPDEKTLYVAQSDPKAALWRAFPVKEDGTLGPGRVFYDATDRVRAGKKGLPDGLKVDVKGNLWATGPGGVLIFSPQGKLLGVIDTGVPTANVGWGEDGSTLFITADMHLARLRTKTKGLGF